MLVYARSKNRPYSLGLFPLEALAHDDTILAAEANRPRITPPPASGRRSPTTWSGASCC